jgi:hypothetical protein
VGRWKRRIVPHKIGTGRIVPHKIGIDIVEIKYLVIQFSTDGNVFVYTILRNCLYQYVPRSMLKLLVVAIQLALLDRLVCSLYVYNTMIMRYPAAVVVPDQIF